MEITGIWEGTLDGTNWGQFLVKLNETNLAVTGTAQIVDIGFGTYILDIKGRRNESVYELSLCPSKHNILDHVGNIDATISMLSEDEIHGEWNSSWGTLGILHGIRKNQKQSNAQEIAKRLVESHAAFIIMAFSDQIPEFSSVVDIHAALDRACATAGVKSHRADEIEHSGVVTSQIQEQIRTNRFLISDLTHQRQNVYYEVGYAHGVGKDVILTAQRGTEVHFDISGYNIIIYSNLTELEERVNRRITAKLTLKEQNSL